MSNIERKVLALLVLALVTGFVLFQSLEGLLVAACLNSGGAV